MRNAVRIKQEGAVLLELLHNNHVVCLSVLNLATQCEPQTMSGYLRGQNLSPWLNDRSQMQAYILSGLQETASRNGDGN